MNDTRVHSRLVSFPLALVIFVCGAGMFQPCAGEIAVESATTTIICIEHLGASDKPVFPLVISAHKPTAAELKLFITRGDDPDFVKLIQLPRADLDRLVKELREWIKPPASRKTDSVDAVMRATIGLIEPATSGQTAPVEREKIVRALNREDASGFLRKLDGFQPHDATAAAVLKEELQNFKRRTQLNPKP